MADYYYCDVCKEPLPDPNISHGGACEAIRQLQKRVADLERSPIQAFAENIAAGPWMSAVARPEIGDTIVVVNRDLSNGCVVRIDVDVRETWGRYVSLLKIEVWARLNAPGAR